MRNAYLHYHTRGDSSPQGKPRVYFCCHPEDFDRFFHQITEEILELQNCAVYYYPPEVDVPPEERELDLGQMNLVVVPVTYRLLYHDNQAIADALYAIEQHIPVLPIIQEAQLEKTFNQKFGGLHFLNKNDPDPTALPYQEKLKKYLESVLIGDTLAQQIREAFDAYIFLSYRKKDRRYAQELMRLIHQNDFCRDIAIWYDEFLTPGEAFSKAIEKALEKSRLFALVVTPSLLEPGNYVMTTEFPMARDSGKPILPAQMSAVDPDALADSYQDIPPCADAHDEQLLRQSLLNALETVAKRESDEDPKHSFFIGLAYLGGVDVETDYERALELITKAAETGLPEAIQKLVTMYQTGEGVARDYHKAISWQEKLAARYRVIFEEQNSETAYRNLINAIWDLGDDQEAVGNLTGAEDAYLQMRTLAASQAEVYDTRRDLSVSYGMLGSISKSQGQLDEAADWFRQALDIHEALAEETGTVQARRDLSISYDNLGWVSESRGLLDEAVGWYRQALDICTALAEETGTVEARRGLSVSCHNLGRISKSQGQLDEAADWFRQALDIHKALAEETGTVEARRDLAVSYDSLGRISQSQGQLDETADWFRQALDIDRALVAETGTVQDRRYLAVTCNNLGSISQSQGQLDEAVGWYRQALDIRKVLAEETGTVEARSDLSASYDNQGRISEFQGQLAEAGGWYQQALDIRTVLAEETGTVQDRRYLAVSYNSLGRISQSQGQLDEAADWFRQALDIDRALVAETGTVQARRDLSVSCHNLGRISKSRGQLDEAADWFRQALDIHKALAEETGTVEARRDQSISCGMLGDIFQSQGQLDEAADWFRQALDIHKALEEETSTVEARRDLSVSCDKLGDIARSQGHLDEAVGWYRQALDICKVLAEETGTVEARRDLSVSYDNLGDIAKAQERLDEASDWYQQALDIRKVLAEETGTVRARRDLSASYKRLARIAEIHNNKLRPYGKLPREIKKAESWFKQAMEIDKALAEETGTVKSRRELSVSYDNLGRISEPQGQLDEASDWYRQALDIRKVLAEETGTAESLDDLAVSYYNLGTLNGINRELIQQAYNICAQLVQARPNVSRYRKNLGVMEKLLKR